MAVNISRWNLDNYKGRLQNYCAEIRIGIPVYGLISKEGPDNGPTFTCYAEIKDLRIEGTAKTKKGAEQAAAKNTLLELSKVDGLFSQKMDIQTKAQQEYFTEKYFFDIKLHDLNLSSEDHKGINEFK